MMKYNKEFIDCVEDCLEPESTSQQLEEMGILTERALSARRHAGTGPKYRRRWGRVFYRRADVVRFLRNHCQLPEVDALPEEPIPKANRSFLVREVDAPFVEPGLMTLFNSKNIIKRFKDILESYFSEFRSGEEPRSNRADLSLLHIKNLLECC